MGAQWLFMMDTAVVLLVGAVVGLFLASVVNFGPGCGVRSWHDHIPLKGELSGRCLKRSVKG